MALPALVLVVSFALVAFGGRTILQWRTRGDSGWRLGRPHSATEAVARAAVAGGLLGLLVAVVAPAAIAVRWDARIDGWLGAATCLVGIAVVVRAQLDMGASWRIGIDPAERTDLVTTGCYRHVRNPIYTGMVVFAAGLAVLTGSIVAVLAAVVLVLGVELQVRAVEEPYLRSLHGPAYCDWSASAGRFVPRVGRGRPRHEVAGPT